MIYQSTHQAPTMSSAHKASPRLQQRKLQSTASKSLTSRSRTNSDIDNKQVERFRGRCRVQWSEKHVKEGLVLVQETQLARVVKTGPISEHYEIDSKPFARCVDYFYFILYYLFFLNIICISLNLFFVFSYFILSNKFNIYCLILYQ